VYGPPGADPNFSIAAKASQAENPWSRKRGFVLLNTVPRRFSCFPVSDMKIYSVNKSKIMYNYKF
jgi:hypothetical protein